MRKLIIASLMMSVFSFDGMCAINLKQNTVADNQVYDERMGVPGPMKGEDDFATVEILKNDIRVLDEEIAKCQKQKKAWTAATIIGGVGVVATGVSALVQNKKIQDKKEELKSKKEELKEQQAELKELKNN